MMISFRPVRSVGAQLYYTFGDDAVTVSDGETTEHYDFSGLPDGRAESIDHGTLPLEGVLAAERTNGELVLTLLLTRGRYAPEEVIRPKPICSVDEAAALLAARDDYPDPEDEAELLGDDDDD